MRGDDAKGRAAVKHPLYFVDARYPHQRRHGGLERRHTNLARGLEERLECSIST